METTVEDLFSHKLCSWINLNQSGSRVKCQSKQLMLLKTAGYYLANRMGTALFYITYYRFQMDLDYGSNLFYFKFYVMYYNPLRKIEYNMNVLHNLGQSRIDLINHKYKVTTKSLLLNTDNLLQTGEANKYKKKKTKNVGCKLCQYKPSMNVHKKLILFLKSILNEMMNVLILQRRVFFFVFVYSITCRNNASISNFGGNFRWQSEYPWCIIQKNKKSDGKTGILRITSFRPN
ncbi:hypothetical protein AGLY_006871 [Aphis glycines]|uniref:Uncharacterized protein n=1 Tax=Aphis glycines TaxID=307491 RepID=A0A6G0TS73_APHGL|nr:hypothetical protein AGLY_006871 [Aphis glycines]